MLNPLSVVNEGDMKGDSCDANIDASAVRIMYPAVGLSSLVDLG